MSRRRRLSVLVLAGILVLAISGVAGVAARLGPIGSGYAAKTVCSGVFVSGRDAHEVFAEDVRADNHPLLGLTSMRVDRARSEVHARFVGLHQRRARYEPGAGCTLDPAARPVPAMPVLGSPAAPLPTAPHPALESLLASALATPGPHTRALAVMHNGRLLAQAYAPGFGPHTPLPGWSMTKTATAVLAGMAVRSGTLRLDRGHLLPEWSDDERRDITLEHLLRMTDGLAFDERADNPLSDVVTMLLLEPDAAGFAADKPLQFAPGTTWRYSSGSSNVLMRVVARASGFTPPASAHFPRTTLFDALGMHSAVIEPDASGLPVGSSFMYADAHDWLRLGQFLLQDGVWEGVRLLPEGWIAYMATPTPVSGERSFGAHVWLRIPTQYADPASVARRLPADAFHAVGHEGQLLTVIPSWELVTLRLGMTRNPHRWDHHGFLADVLAHLAHGD